MALSKRVIPIRIKGLNNKSSPELSVVTDLDSCVNAMVVKTTDQGFEFRKRFGINALTKNIEGGGTVGAGFKVCSINNELMITDGSVMYSYSSTLNKWVKKGYVPDIACNTTSISTSTDSESITVSGALLDVDVAYLGGYLCYVASRPSVGGSESAEWYVIDRATGVMVGNGPINTTNSTLAARVVGIASAFYIFYANAANLVCRKIDIATPETIGGATNVATNLNASRLYDVIADTTNTRILVAYRNTTPTLTIMVWNTNMTAGTTTAYATRDPDKCIGFLDDVTPLNVAIGTSATGVRILTFNTSTLVVGTDTLVDGAATDAVACTGYNSGTLNVLYTRPGTPSRNDVTSCWKLAAGSFIVARSVSLQSRPFTTGTPGGSGKRYVLVGHNEDSGVSPVGGGDRVRSLFLMQLDQDGSAQSNCRVSGVLLGGNWGTWAKRDRGLGSFALVSSTVIVCGAPGIVGPTVTSSGAFAVLVQSLELDFSGTNTGIPVQFNNETFFPGASCKVYDGRNVFENGFYHRPDQPALTVILGGGAMTAGLVQFLIVYSYIDSNGKLWRSSPSAISSVTVAANDRITVVMPNLRLTDRNPLFAFSDQVNELSKIELYQTKPNQSIFYASTIIVNDASTDSQSITLATDQVSGSELVYTQSGPLPNEYPPAVIAACAHGDRLFFMCGDKSVWFTRELENDEDMPASSSLFRIQFGSEFGSLTGIASMDTGLVISRKTKINVLTGQGPSKDGNGTYQYPIQLPVDVGFKNVRAFCGTQDGILFQSQKAMQLLTRGLTVSPVYGIEDFESLTNITGAVALDSLPFIAFSMSQTYCLVYDWQLKLWYVWFNGTQFSAVANAKWQGSLVLLASDGTVNVQGAAYTDNSVNQLFSLALGWISVGDIFRNPRVYNLQWLLKVVSSTTLSTIFRYDYNLANSEAARTLAVTSADSGVVLMRPSRRLLQSVYVSFSETSAGEGIRVMAFGLEIGMKPGSKKQPSTRLLT